MFLYNIDFNYDVLFWVMGEWLSIKVFCLDELIFYIDVLVFCYYLLLFCYSYLFFCIYYFIYFVCMK